MPTLLLFYFARLSICSVQTNRSECNALVKSYMECAQYVVVKEAPASSFLADQVGNSFNQFLTDTIFVKFDIKMVADGDRALIKN